MFRVHCQKCNRGLVLPDKARTKRIRCPSCQATFYLNEPNAPPPPAEDSSSGVEAMEEEEVIDFRDIDSQFDEQARRDRAGRTRIAMLLQLIGTCLGSVAVLLTIIFLIIIWAKAPPVSERGVIIGIPALFGWTLSAIAASFAISGINRRHAVGYAISYSVAAVCHIALLLIVVARTSGPSTQMPPVFGNESVLVGRGSLPPQLQFFITALPFDVAIFGYFSEAIHRYVGDMLGCVYVADFIVPFGFLPLLAGLVEIARIVSMALWMRAVARSIRSYDMDFGCIGLLVGLAITLGVFFLINLIVSLVAVNAPDRGEGYRHLVIVVQLFFLAVLLAGFITASAIAHTLWKRLGGSRPPVS